MNNIINIAKINLKTIFSSMFSFNMKNKKSSTIGMVCLMMFLMVYMGYFYYITFEQCQNEGVLIFGFLSPATISFAFILLFIMYEMQGYFFKTKDFEMLESLPIPTYQITIGKLSSIFCSAYIYQTIFLLPAVVCYFLFAPVTIGAILCAIIGLILTPIIPLSIGALFGLLIAYLATKFKRRNLVNVLFTSFLTIGFIVLYFLINSSTYGIENGDPFAIMKYAFPSSYLFIFGCIIYDTVNFLILLGVSFFAIFIFTFLMSKTYKKINRALANSTSVISKKEIEFKQNSICGSLIKKEAKTFFANSTYVMNSGLGLLFAIIAPFLFYFSGFDLTALGIQGLSTIVVVIVATAMMFAVSSTSCCSFNVEGKFFYISKHLPIKLKDIFASKILFNIIIAAPFIIIATISNLIFFASQMNLIEIIAVVVLPWLAISSASIFGLLMNLCFPNINFLTIMQAVKQSASVFATIVVLMLVHMLFFVLLGLFPLSSTIVILILTALYVILTGVSLIFLKLKGEKLYLRIN